MKHQSGDSENWNNTVKNLRDHDEKLYTVAELENDVRIAEFKSKYKRRRRTTDIHDYRVVDKSGRMLAIVLTGSALFALGFFFALFFLAVGGDFNLIEWGGK